MTQEKTDAPWPQCGEAYEPEDGLERAIRSMAAAGEVVSARLTRAEESMYYAVLDALQDQQQDPDDG